MTSSRSAPSSCSARSSTPTARGSASSSPRSGIDTCEHRKVGDNLDRMVQCLRELLDRADAVIVCGGIGPTPDDVTREAIAEVMGVELERREELIEHDPRASSAGAAAPMPENNLRQADVPDGGDVIPNPIGTAPGLRCEVDDRRRDEGRLRGARRALRDDRDGHASSCCPTCSSARGERAVIVSRSLKTWGTSESGLAEMIAERVDQQTNPTIAFLARGIEGIYVRMTAKAPTEDEARDAARRGRRRAAHGARRARVRGRRRDDGVRGAAAVRGARAGRSASPSRSPAGSSAPASPTCPAPAARSAARSRRTPPR